MSRSGAVTFKGTPMTLAGSEVKLGQPAPDFTIHYFEGGLKTITPADLKGKPTFISVVPSLDTPVCQTQTKKFNDELAALGDKVNAVTVSLDLPFAMNRFCGAERIKNMRVGSDYQNRNFGQNWGMLIEELKLLSTRRVRARQGRQGRLCRDGAGSDERAELRSGHEIAQGIGVVPAGTCQLDPTRKLKSVLPGRSAREGRCGQSADFAAQLPN